MKQYLEPRVSQTPRRVAFFVVAVKSNFTRCSLRSQEVNQQFFEIVLMLYHNPVRNFKIQFSSELRADPGGSKIFLNGHFGREQISTGCLKHEISKSVQETREG